MCGFLIGQLTAQAEHEDRYRERWKLGFSSLAHRGPDASRIVEVKGRVWVGFHRLAVQDLSDAGNQPFVWPSQASQVDDYLVCNGEIYNQGELKQRLGHGYIWRSRSDCEVLLPLIKEEGFGRAVSMLDAEFALVYYEAESDRLLAARDPIGIRPLFYGRTSQGGWAFASEAKALQPVCIEIKPFPPGHLFDGQELVPYRLPARPSQLRSSNESIEQVAAGVAERLEVAVCKRLKADAQVGFLLSGGLDSSLVCALAQKQKSQPIRTFAVGCDVDAIDIAYAAQVADHIGSDHTTVTFTHTEAIAALPEVIEHLESFDITTIRAAVGMYLVCKHIRASTDIKVLLTGEVSDEMFGYKYTDFAPDPEAFQEEASKRVEEIYRYDVLRADRSLAAHSLEARVPFADLDLVDYVMQTHPELKLNRHGLGKYLLRRGFFDSGLLPDSILMREKAAFSDAVGHSVVDVIKQHAAAVISDQDFAKSQALYSLCPPVSKEALLYRQMFEESFPGRADWIGAYWMPNAEWSNCAVHDPSARFLPNYGASGT